MSRVSLRASTRASRDSVLIACSNQHCKKTQPGGQFGQWNFRSLKEGEDPQVLCNACTQKFDQKYFCPVCSTFYHKEYLDQWIGCDHCPRWVHKACVTREGEDTFKCPDCGGETSLTTLGGPRLPQPKKRVSSSRSEAKSKAAKIEGLDSPNRTGESVKETKKEDGARAASDPSPTKSPSKKEPLPSSSNDDTGHGRPSRKSKTAARDRTLAMRISETSGGLWGAVEDDRSTSRKEKGKPSDVNKKAPDTNKRRPTTASKAKPTKSPVTNGKAGSQTAAEDEEDQIVFFLKPNQDVGEKLRLMPIDKEEVHATPKLTVYHLKKVIQRKLNLQCELSDLSISCGNMALGDEHTLSFVKDFVWRNSDSFMEVYYALKERL